MKRYKIYSMLLLLFIVGGCKKYLDQKPDLTMMVPESLADCQLLLDDYGKMNASYPDHGEAAADNYYLTDATWNELGANSEPSDNYIWAPQGQHTMQWLKCYEVVFNANLVLQVLDKFPSNSPNYSTLRGSSLFFRAFAFYNVAQLFAKPYSATTANIDPGIPLRLSADLNVKSKRGTVHETYDRIIQDLKEAVVLLPVSTTIVSRPSKAAAYAALARTYLAMEDYANAGKMADECLKLYSTLIDYNQTSAFPTTTTVSSMETGPSFIRFNAEVIFQSTTMPGILNDVQAIVDPNLYDSYDLNDRRKNVFFGSGIDPWTGLPTENNTFRGSYDGTTDGGSLFNGLATDEVYLIRAECLARQGNTIAAMKDLNNLMIKRVTPPYTNRTATDATDALMQILIERRKELPFRTLRWTDLRRLNKDPNYAVTLLRNMNTITHIPLKPNDLRYVMLIPLQVINTTNMQQNPR